MGSASGYAPEVGFRSSSASVVAFALAPLLALMGGSCALSHERAPGDREPSFGPELASSASLAIDATSLYWADSGRGSIVRAPRGGGPVTLLAPATPALYAPLTVTATDVLWVDAGGESIEVFRVPIGGGARALVAAGHGGPIGIAADAEHAYFSRSVGGFDLLEVAFAGGAERVVAPDVAALGLRLDEDDLFGTSCGPDGVFRIARATGRRTVLVPASFCPVTLSIDATHVYFSDYAEPTMPGVGGSGIFRAARAGGVASRVTLSAGLAFAVHRGHVYVSLDRSIVEVSGDGLRAIEVAPAGGTVRGIAVDDDFVYWTEEAEDGALDLALAPRPR